MKTELSVRILLVALLHVVVTINVVLFYVLSKFVFNRDDVDKCSLMADDVEKNLGLGLGLRLGTLFH
jgi:hypothetical protein